MDVQEALPTLGGALIVGPLFVVIEMPGEPRSKGRHRSRIVIPKDKRKPPFIHNYPDPDTEAYEKALAQLGAILMRGRKPTERPLFVRVEACKTIPKSWPRRDYDAAMSGRLLPTGRPDGDNYLKVACDALNEIVWADDSQIVDARVVKVYSLKPALRIEVREFVAP